MAARERDGDAVDEAVDTGVESAKPHRTVRTLTIVVMVVTSVLTGLLAWSLMGEAKFAFNRTKAEPIGVLAAADLGSEWQDRYARATVTLDAAPTVHFTRPLDGAASYRAALDVAGEGAAERWVIYQVPHSLAGPRFLPPHLVAGRLTRVSELGARYRGLAAAMRDVTGKDPSQAWVIIDGDTPVGSGWLLGLEVLLFAFLLFNLVSLWRVLRRVR